VGYRKDSREVPMKKKKALMFGSAIKNAPTLKVTKRVCTGGETKEPNVPVRGPAEEKNLKIGVSIKLCSSNREGETQPIPGAGLRPVERRKGGQRADRPRRKKKKGNRQRKNKGKTI